MSLISLNEITVLKFDRNLSFPDFYLKFAEIIERKECLVDCQCLKLLKRSKESKIKNLLTDVGTNGELYKPTLEGLYDTCYNQRSIIAEYFAAIADIPVVKTMEM